MNLKYITKPKNIFKSSLKSSRFSLCPKDYRILTINNNNLKKLNSLVLKHFVGKEIGSDSYMPKSDYRFLKTVNITDEFILNTTTIEYSKPNKSHYPQKNNILIVKDGGTEGLAQVCLYPFENSKNIDTISAGILSLTINEEDLFYVLGILKSSHFKNFVNLNTPEGSTIRHSKKIALEYLVPFPNSVEVHTFVSLLVQNILDKENQISKKLSLINDLINSELISNQLVDEFNSFNTISSLKANDLRFDSGMYSIEYKRLRFLIENYSNGFFNIPIEQIKSGSTPKVRYFSKKANNKWVTPTDINNNGFFISNENINSPGNCNLNKNSILFINRTSKGKKGEFVGIACYYDFHFYGKGHHNQGIYRVEDFEDIDKHFIIAFMNSEIMRKICGFTSLGTKMKEMKMKNFSDLIFPNFSSTLKLQISKLYYNNLDISVSLDIDNYFAIEKSRNNEIGIFQLHAEILELKSKLENVVNKIILDEDVIIEFN